MKKGLSILMSAAMLASSANLSSRVFAAKEDVDKFLVGLKAEDFDADNVQLTTDEFLALLGDGLRPEEVDEALEVFLAKKTEFDKQEKPKEEKADEKQDEREADEEEVEQKEDPKHKEVREESEPEEELNEQEADEEEVEQKEDPKYREAEEGSKPEEAPKNEEEQLKNDFENESAWRKVNKAIFDKELRLDKIEDNQLIELLKNCKEKSEYEITDEVIAMVARVQKYLREGKISKFYTERQIAEIFDGYRFVRLQQKLYDEQKQREALREEIREVRGDKGVVVAEVKKILNKYKVDEAEKRSLAYMWVGEKDVVRKLLLCFDQAEEAYKLACEFEMDKETLNEICENNPRAKLMKAVKDNDYKIVEECLKVVDSLDGLFISEFYFYDDDDDDDDDDYNSDHAIIFDRTRDIPILEYAIKHSSADIVKALMQKVRPDVNLNLCRDVIRKGNVSLFENMIKGFDVASPEMNAIVLEVLNRGMKDWLKIIKERGYKIQSIEVLSRAFETDFGIDFAEGITDYSIIKDNKIVAARMIFSAVKNNKNQVLESLLKVCTIDEQQRKDLLKEAMRQNNGRIGYTLIREQQFDLQTIVDLIRVNDNFAWGLLKKDYLKIDKETKLSSMEDLKFLLSMVFDKSAFDFFQELIKSDALKNQIKDVLSSKNEMEQTFLHKVFEDWTKRNYSPFDKKGLTPKENTYQINILRKLIEMAGDLSQKDVNGDMLLHCAARCRCCGAFDSLESWSAVNAVGETPLTELVNTLLNASDKKEFEKAFRNFNVFINLANAGNKISLEDRYQAITLLLSKKVMEDDKNNILLLQLITTKRKSQLLCMAVNKDDGKVIDELITFFESPGINTKVVYKNSLIYALEKENVKFLKFISHKLETGEDVSQAIDESIKSDGIKKLIAMHRAVFYLSKKFSEEDLSKKIEESLNKLTQKIVEVLLSLDTETMQATMDEVEKIDHEQVLILMKPFYEYQRKIEAIIGAFTKKWIGSYNKENDE